MSKANQLGVGIVGCGRIGSRHAEIAERVGTVTSICDIVDDQRLPLGKRYAVPTYDNIDSLLKGSGHSTDVIAICTPNFLHAEHTVKALNAGYHVICEKPMALTVEDCTRMITAAEQNNRRIFVVKQNRYNPPVEFVYEKIKNGDLGRIHQFYMNCIWNRDHKYYDSDWKGSAVKDGGLLFTQFSHFIDLLYWFFGDVSEVAAMRRQSRTVPGLEFENCGAALLRFTSGVIGTVNFGIDSYDKNFEGSLSIIGENGTIKIGGQYLNELEYSVGTWDDTVLSVGRPANQYGHYIGSMSNHEDVYENVRDVIFDSAKIGTSGIEGLKTVELIQRIYAACQ